MMEVDSTVATEIDASTHTSARTQRIEVITCGERRWRWSLEEKRAIYRGRRYQYLPGARAERISSMLRKNAP
jgi:hypothetical protein